MYKYLNLFAIELLNYRVCLVFLGGEYMIEGVWVSPFPVDEKSIDSTY
jgi:hypothetical protein